MGVVVLSIEDAYRKWAAELVRYATAIVGPDDAADVVSAAFLTLVRRGDDSWSDIRDHRPYLFRAVLNQALSGLRARSRRHRDAWQMSEPVVWTELLDDPAVLAAVRSLSLQQRAITFLTYWEDMSVGDIAVFLDVHDGTVRRQLARSRSKLRKVLT